MQRHKTKSHIIVRENHGKAYIIMFFVAETRTFFITKFVGTRQNFLSGKLPKYPGAGDANVCLYVNLTHIVKISYVSASGRQF